MTDCSEHYYSSHLELKIKKSANPSILFLFNYFILFFGSLLLTISYIQPRVHSHAFKEETLREKGAYFDALDLFTGSPELLEINVGAQVYFPWEIEDHVLRNIFVVPDSSD